MSHKELTSHIRNRIKAAGIKARVKMNADCGTKYITVVTPSFDARFTSEEIKTICTIAQCNKLTYVRNIVTGKQIGRAHV